MKYTHLFVLFIIGFFSQQAIAQASDSSFFEGSIHYQVKYSGSTADDIRMNKPNNKLTMHIKDGSYIVNLSGGQVPKTFLYVNHRDREFSVNAQQKVFYKYAPHMDMNRKIRKIPTAIPTGKTIELRGILCQEYKIKRDDGYFTLYYISDDYRVNLDFYKDKKRAKTNFLIKGLDGRIPLKTIKKMSGLAVTTTANKIVNQEFLPAQFLVPKGFEVRNRDYRP